jgi:hypothetical protein
MSSDFAMSLGETLCLNALDPSKITPGDLIAIVTGNPGDPQSQFFVNLVDKFIYYDVNTRELHFGGEDLDIMECDSRGDDSATYVYRSTLRADQFIANGDAYRSWQKNHRV